MPVDRVVLIGLRINNPWHSLILSAEREGISTVYGLEFTSNVSVTRNKADQLINIFFQPNYQL